jgi:hypothetical protein
MLLGPFYNCGGSGPDYSQLSVDTGISDKTVKAVFLAQRENGYKCDVVLKLSDLSDMIFDLLDAMPALKEHMLKELRVLKEKGDTTA